MSTTMPRSVVQLPDRMNGQGLTIKQGEQVDHSLHSSKGTALLEQRDPLVLSPDNQGAKQSPAARVLHVSMSLFGSRCCSGAESGCAVSLQRGRVTSMIIRLLSGLQHPLYSCPHSFLGHKEVSQKTNLTEISYRQHYQMCVFVF